MSAQGKSYLQTQTAKNKLDTTSKIMVALTHELYNCEPEGYAPGHRPPQQIHVT